MGVGRGQLYRWGFSRVHGRASVTGSLFNKVARLLRGMFRHPCFSVKFYEAFRHKFFREHLRTLASHTFFEFINYGQKNTLSFSVHIDALLQILLFHQMLLFVEIFPLLLSIFKVNWYFFINQT